MKRQVIFRLLVFAIIIVGIIFLLTRFSRKQAQEEEEPFPGEVLPAQVERIVERLKDFPEEEEIDSLEEKVLGTFKRFVPELLRREEEKISIEQKVEEIIQEIKSLPEDQIRKIKKEVFCTEVCQEKCQEVCE